MGRTKSNTKKNTKKMSKNMIPRKNKSGFGDFLILALFLIISWKYVGLDIYTIIIMAIVALILVYNECDFPLIIIYSGMAGMLAQWGLIWYNKNLNIFDNILLAFVSGNILLILASFIMLYFVSEIIKKVLK
ncbi:hypothetical protein [Methanococcus maripaludis]|uniref:Uncharacterized protein n=2 Tax=Methanococcus maripaludis TaxID=39152 RepID=A0A7J9PFY6_METMI|nr:hypothetical protein [Methanococcus maripaludis]MBA2861607.1 hypothetical protein [Methanococcus maripaludis]